MGSWSVSCESCGHTWQRVGNFSEYERAAVESRPCPGCGAYTLACPGPQPSPRLRRLTESRRPVKVAA